MYNCWNQTITEPLWWEKMGFFFCFSSFFLCLWSFFSGCWARQDSGPNNLRWHVPPPPGPPSNTPLVAVVFKLECSCRIRIRSDVKRRENNGTKLQRRSLFENHEFLTLHTCTTVDIEELQTISISIFHQLTWFHSLRSIWDIEKSLFVTALPSKLRHLFLLFLLSLPFLHFPFFSLLSLKTFIKNKQRESGFQKFCSVKPFVDWFLVQEAKAPTVGCIGLEGWEWWAMATLLNVIFT